MSDLQSAWDEAAQQGGDLQSAWDETAPKPAPEDGVMRQLGLTARAGIKGAADIADIVASPVRTALNIVANPPRNIDDLLRGRTDDPFKAGQLGEMLTGWLPEPVTKEEKVAANVASAMAGGGFVGPVASAASRFVGPISREVLASLSAGPKMNVTMSGVSSGASEAAKDSGAGALGQSAAGIAAPLAAVAFGHLGGRLTDRIANIFDAALMPGGATRAAGRVATDVAGDDAANIARLIRQEERPLTAAQAASPASSAEFSGLERAVAPNLPSEYAKEVGSIAKQQQTFAKEGMSALNEQLTPVREAILTFARNSGKTNVAPILGVIDSKLSDPNIVGNTPLNSALSHYRKLISEIADPETGIADPFSLYGIRKNAGLAMETLGKQQGWDKKVTSGVTRDIQTAIDDVITSASGVRTKSGESAWKEQYLTPFSQGAKYYGDVAREGKPGVMVKTSDKLGAAGAKKARGIAGTDEAPMQAPSLLDRGIMVLNTLLRYSQGYGGQRTNEELARLMTPENKQALAELMQSQIMKNASPSIKDVMSSALLANVVGAQ